MPNPLEEDSAGALVAANNGAQEKQQNGLTTLGDKGIEREKLPRIPSTMQKQRHCSLNFSQMGSSQYLQGKLSQLFLTNGGTHGGLSSTLSRTQSSSDEAAAVVSDQKEVTVISSKEVLCLSEVFGVPPARVREVAVASEGDRELMLAILQSEWEDREQRGEPLLPSAERSRSGSITEVGDRPKLQYGSKHAVRRIMKLLDLSPLWEGEIIHALNATKGDAQGALSVLTMKMEMANGAPAQRLMGWGESMSEQDMIKVQDYISLLDKSLETTKAQALQTEFEGRTIKDIEDALRLTDGDLNQARLYLQQVPAQKETRRNLEALIASPKKSFFRKRERRQLKRYPSVVSIACPDNAVSLFPHTARSRSPDEGDREATSPFSKTTYVFRPTDLALSHVELPSHLKQQNAHEKGETTMELQPKKTELPEIMREPADLWMGKMPRGGSVYALNNLDDETDDEPLSPQSVAAIKSAFSPNKQGRSSENRSSTSRGLKMPPSLPTTGIDGIYPAAPSLRGTAASSGLPPPPPPPPPPPGAGAKSGLPPPPPPPPGAGAKSGLPPPPPPPPPPGAGTKSGLPPPPPPPPGAGTKSGLPPPPPPPPGAGTKSGLPPPPPPPPPKAKSGPAQPGPTRSIPIDVVKNISKVSVFKAKESIVLPELYRRELANEFRRVEKKPMEREPLVMKEVIIDPNRERNVGIVLQFLRLPIQTIEARVRTFDELTLGEEHISGLVKIIPHAEDLRPIEAWMRRNPKASVARLHQLSIPVRFFMMTMKIGHYAERLQCWNLKNEFKGRIDDLEVKICRTLEGVSAVMESTQLPRLLQVVLAVSNFLNTGSRFQEAKGFRVTQLPQIIEFPTTNNNRVLLDYLVEIIDQQDPALHNWTEELLSAAENASNFDVPGVAGELKSVRARLQKCASLVRAIPDDKPWTTKLGKFIYTAFPALDHVEQLMSELNAKIELMPAYFCENSSSFSMNDTMRCLANFAKKYNRKRDQLAAKQMRLSRLAAKDAENSENVTEDPNSRVNVNESHKVQHSLQEPKIKVEKERSKPSSPAPYALMAKGDRKGTVGNGRGVGRRTESLNNGSCSNSSNGETFSEPRLLLFQ
ncbi:putative formin [Trypanosoma cruzi]|uniref:Formin A n=2 Tax=Trypanosoma cruzi TaxID=5693 RepID=Q4DJ48_TRYCC|nr:formin, putative [Trypanosoma cruzi]ABF13405.1 formin A [Trypanosoma cruzi strain CL Brener]EAN92551.1 formin, putative [Trypanosoma cruzi]PWV16426.1 putative formin [Trypanosoma cruzi]|eukprot:XP_814402.1 formin [Trypanosoma cruzi strain CL Brener]